MKVFLLEEADGALKDKKIRKKMESFVAEAIPEKVKFIEKKEFSAAKNMYEAVKNLPVIQFEVVLIRKDGSITKMALVDKLRFLELLPHTPLSSAVCAISCLGSKGNRE